LTSGSFTGVLQDIHDLHIRVGHLDPSRRRRPEEGRAPVGYLWARAVYNRNSIR
jgi:hypothetical protein